MSLQLLPSGYFEIHLKKGAVIKGHYSAAALKFLSQLNGDLNFSDTFRLLTDTGSLASYMQLILCAVKAQSLEDGSECKYSEFDVLEWLEELGGFNSDESKKLIAHFQDGFMSKKKPVMDGQSVGQS